MKAYFKANWRMFASIAALVAIVVGGLIWQKMHTTVADETSDKIVREVSVASVAELSSGSVSLPVVGAVRSQDEAQIRAESSGSITHLYRKLGDQIGAGQIIAEIENGSERAGVLQAQGAYEAAKAALDKIKGGTREEQLSILDSAVKSARGSAVTTLLSSYAAGNSAVKDVADPMFSNPETSSQQFNPTVSNSQAKINAETMRTQLVTVIKREAAASALLSATSDLKAELSTTENELRAVRAFMDALMVALGSAISSPNLSDATIATYKANVGAARTTLTSSLTAIISARSALEVTEKNQELGVTGAQSQDVAATEAQVKQAEGAYNAALANLEKTIIRSPISGTLNNLSIHLGDFVSGFQQVAIVSNNGSLEVLAYVTEDDLPSLSVGTSVQIESTIKGTIVRIAPAIDPTNHKIEVRIALPENAGLTNGQSVHVELVRSRSTTSRAGPVTIPISALKMSSDAAFVFTLDEKNALVAHQVGVGALSGDKIEITSGVTPEMQIVVDARGLKEGDVVVNEKVDIRK